MSDPYDIFGPSRKPNPVRARSRRPGQRPPTLEDFEKLTVAYRELHAQSEQLVKALQEKDSEIQIKDEALRQQGDDLKQFEAESVMLKAGLKQAQEELDSRVEELEKAQTDDASWQERYQRMQAEMENTRKRTEQRYARQSVEARNRVLLDMLPLADHLDLAIQHSEQHLSTLDDKSVKDFVGSIDITRRAFLDTLKRYGISRINSKGQPFDPAYHEALGQIEDDSVPPDHVAQVIQAGYLHEENVIRAARVIVSKSVTQKVPETSDAVEQEPDDAQSVENDHNAEQNNMESSGPSLDAVDSE